MTIYAILIVVDGKVYRAKQDEWPIQVKLSYDRQNYLTIYPDSADAVRHISCHVGVDRSAILAACFDVVEEETLGESHCGDCVNGFTLERLTGKD